MDTFFPVSLQRKTWKESGSISKQKMAWENWWDRNIQTAGALVTMSCKRLSFTHEDTEAKKGEDDGVRWQQHWPSGPRTPCPGIWPCPVASRLWVNLSKGLRGGPASGSARYYLPNRLRLLSWDQEVNRLSTKPPDEQTSLVHATSRWQAVYPEPGCNSPSHQLAWGLPTGVSPKAAA